MTRKKNGLSELKECPVNPAHIWMADIPYCPYCHISPEARAAWAAATNWSTRPYDSRRAEHILPATKRKLSKKGNG
jgi:hypothetical protein